MKIKVLVDFRDKDNYAKVYKAGEELTFPDDRASHIVGLGLAVALDAPKVEPVSEPKPTEAEEPKARRSPRKKENADAVADAPKEETPEPEAPKEEAKAAE